MSSKNSTVEQLPERQLDQLHTSEADGTVGKALHVLDSISSFGRPMRFSEICRTCKYPKATLYRLLKTLERQRFIECDSNKYSLGVRLLRIAHSAWMQSSLAQVARRHVDTLFDKTRHTVHLAQLDSGQVLYLYKRGAKDSVHMHSQSGKIAPGYCTGIGKVMLAHLEPYERERALVQQAYHPFTQNSITSIDRLRTELKKIRRTAIAYDNEEHEPGIFCMATPILSDKGKLLGGLSITSSKKTSGFLRLRKHKNVLMNTSKDISNELFDWQFPD